MIGGHWDHVGDNLDRVPGQDHNTLRKAMTGLAKRIKARKVPMRPWYRTVTNSSGRVICHICGQGAYISTILKADMIPRGERI